MSGIRQDVRAREDTYQQVQEEVKELKLQNQKTTETIKRLNEMVIRFLDTMDPKPKSPSASAQPKKSESAKPEVKASGSKEVPIAVESKVKEIDLLTEKPDPPKRQKSKKPPKPSKGKSMARSNPDDSDSSSSSSSADSSASSPEAQEPQLLQQFLRQLRQLQRRCWANWELWSNALSLALEEIGYENGIKLKQLDQLRLAKTITKTCKKAPLKLITGKGGNKDSRNNRPAWNKNGKPLYFNYGKYGHLTKDCPEPQKENSGKGKKGKRGQNGGQRQGSNNSQNNSSRNTRGGGQDEEQFIPKGLKDLYRSNKGTFSAYVNEQQL
ncbi:hypothetical protein DL771_000514 [Monosporascus sp. 5C6A]|nr:hypothetical protein DL771_000514 [Monosporascus sp. 5C6A]